MATKNMARIDNVPEELKPKKQWVLWRKESRGGEATKIPYQITGKYAKVNDPSTWCSFDEAVATLKKDLKAYSGIGFVFSKDDPYCGVDLDDCRDPKTGEIADWAQAILKNLPSYAEVSPSGCGIKIWCKGELPIDPERTGGRVKYHTGQIEMYQFGRYFTFTGNRLSKDREIVDCCTWLKLIYEDAFYDQATPLSACIQDLADLPESISGEQGHDAMFAAACEIVRHRLSHEDTQRALEWFNDNKCFPPWAPHELAHKLKDARRENPTGSEFADTPEPSAPARERWALNLIDDDTFEAAEYVLEYLIDGVLVAGEPVVVGGMYKTLKTSVMVDLILSLGSGTPFLNKFDVPEPAPVAFISGESGTYTLQHTARRVARAKKLDRKKLPVYWGFDLPLIAKQDHLDAVGEAITELGLRVLIVDPAYLCLLGGRPTANTSNVFEMGAILKGYADLGRDTGCTMCLVHHNRKTVDAKNPPTLGDLTQAGFAEFARQWLLLGRRQLYKPGSGFHEMWFSVGGSAGHGGQWALDVNEGQPDDPLTGRRWDLSMTAAGDLEQLKAQQDATEAKALNERVYSVILGADGITARKLRGEAAIGRVKLETILDDLENGELIEFETQMMGGHPVKVYHPVGRQLF